jgi:hypothetical protein
MISTSWEGTKPILCAGAQERVLGVRTVSRCGSRAGRACSLRSQIASWNDPRSGTYGSQRSVAEAQKGARSVQLVPLLRTFAGPNDGCRTATNCAYLRAIRHRRRAPLTRLAGMTTHVPTSRAAGPGCASRDTANALPCLEVTRPRRSSLIEGPPRLPSIDLGPGTAPRAAMPVGRSRAKAEASGRAWAVTSSSSCSSIAADIIGLHRHGVPRPRWQLRPHAARPGPSGTMRHPVVHPAEVSLAGRAASAFRSNFPLTLRGRRSRKWKRRGTM